MYLPGILANVVKEMKRVQVDIIGVCERTWIENGEIGYAEGKIHYSGSTDTRH